MAKQHAWHSIGNVELNDIFSVGDAGSWLGGT
jgi:hypothetical protein